MYKMGELNTRAGRFVIYYDNAARVNPYRIYKKWWNGGWHRELVEKYADLYSCTIYINDFVRDHNEDRRPTA